MPDTASFRVRDVHYGNGLSHTGVTAPHERTGVTQAENVTLDPSFAVTQTQTVTAELHPNVTVFTDLGFDKLKWPKSPAQRSKEYRARKAA